MCQKWFFCCCCSLGTPLSHITMSLTKTARRQNCIENETQVVVITRPNKPMHTFIYWLLNRAQYQILKPLHGSFFFPLDKNCKLSWTRETQRKAKLTWSWTLKLQATKDLVHFSYHIDKETEAPWGRMLPTMVWWKNWRQRQVFRLPNHIQYVMRESQRYVQFP